MTRRTVPSTEPSTDPDTLSELTARVTRELATIDGELAEIEMLVQQARTEAERHELKRSQTAEKLAGMPEAAPPEDVIAVTSQLVTMTRRASVMEAQVEVLEGKHKTLLRFRESLGEIGDSLGVAVVGGLELDRTAPGLPLADEQATPAMSRIVLSAQEDLRREIARAMHDGPAQSLTNIVLQAQIVERIVAKDPELARAEVRQLVSMVQQTLDATKSFIFDVRPMVLDDLGLVPTVRRAARERGQRAGVAVEFESMGADRRLPMDLESGLFRLLDEAMGAYLSAAPDRVSVRLDWQDEALEGHVAAIRDRSRAVDDAEKEVASRAVRPSDKDLPPALAAMMEDRREQAEAAAEAARSAAIVSLPADAWREIQQRAATVGITAELLASGGEMRIAVDFPVDEPAAEPAAAEPA
ncbi:MAG TPA: histidine kinase [Candidatus Limnocylindrales bacterium]|nr:histidine kinase [Candidatus Limnocylindrales bacterium]